MPGESEAPVRHLYLFDMENKSYKEIKSAAFKDQEIRILNQPVLQKNYGDSIMHSVWMGTTDKFYVANKP
ncbi:hypothetical protein MASR1M46_13800 [Bacteroidales bacterium]